MSALRRRLWALSGGRARSPPPRLSRPGGSRSLYPAPPPGTDLPGRTGRASLRPRADSEPIAVGAAYLDLTRTRTVLQS